MRRWSRASRSSSERGAAAVEFALVMPFLCLLVLGILQYGLYFWAHQGGSDIARDAARLSAVGEPPACADFRIEVSNQIRDLTGTQASAAITRAYDSDGDVEVGDKVVVTVSFDSVDLQIPLLPFIDDGRVTTTAEAMVEYAPTPPQECA